MIHDTIPRLKAEVQRWCTALGISQNEYARRCGIDQSILSRVLRGTVTSKPAETKMREYNARLQRRLEKAS
jgi:transcriptional regulator with XRE-family HTH domain